MKNIFVPITSGRGVRNFLRTDIWDYLRKNDLRPIVLIAASLYNELKEELSGDFILETYNQPSPMERKLLVWRYLDTYSAATNFSVTSETNLVKRKRFRRQHYFKYLITRAVNFIVYHFDFFGRWIEKLDWRLLPKQWCADLFNKYQPVLVLSTDMITNHDEIYILEYAQRKRIPVIASILSWDNLSGYGKLPVAVNRIIVWNEIMAGHLRQWHGVKKENIFVAGAPQYDVYFRTTSASLTRDQFFQIIGADPQRKLLTYTTAPASICDTEDEILKNLSNSLDQLITPTQLLVRPHPKDTSDRYREILQNKNVIFMKPGHSVRGFLDQWSPTEQDVLKLSATLKYSDILINVASTITIEAAIFDKPVINIGFDGRERPYEESVTRYYNDYTHYLNIIKTGGVKLAQSFDELLIFINQYLIDPALDRGGRKKIVQEQVGGIDGRASERVANYIINYVKDSCN